MLLLCLVYYHSVSVLPAAPGVFGPFKSSLVLAASLRNSFTTWGLNLDIFSRLPELKLTS